MLVYQKQGKRSPLACAECGPHPLYLAAADPVGACKSFPGGTHRAADIFNSLLGFRLVKTEVFAYVYRKGEVDGTVIFIDIE